MTPQEKDLIQTVFDRLAKAGGGTKDAEAATFIQEQLRRQPDAAYGLTQAVIVLEAGLNQAQQKIAEMQRQLDEARAGSGSGSSGGFLGGASPWGSSVPRSGPAPQPQPAYVPQPVYAQPQQPWPQAAPAAGPWAPQPSGGSSFLSNAATMAVGVAGGTLIAEGLSNMFGHHSGGGYGYGGGFGGGGFGGGPEIIEERTTVTNNYFDDRSSGGGGRDHDSGTQDASYQDASYDDGGAVDDGGFDDSGTDV